MNRSRALTLGFFGFICFSLLGCSKASNEDCKKLADKVVELAIDGLPNKPGEAGQKAAEEKKKELARKCGEDRPSASQIECMLAAKSATDFDNC